MGSLREQDDRFEAYVRGRYVLLAPDGCRNDPALVIRAESFCDAAEKAFPLIACLRPMWPNDRPAKTPDGEWDDGATLMAAGITWTGTRFIVARCPVGAEGKSHLEVWSALPRVQLVWAKEQLKEMRGELLEMARR